MFHTMVPCIFDGVGGGGIVIGCTGRRSSFPFVKLFLYLVKIHPGHWEYFTQFYTVSNSLTVLVKCDLKSIITCLSVELNST